VAEVDILRGWADLAREANWCQPLVDDSDVLEVEQGRHPVVERMLQSRPGAGSFVPNDTRLAGSGEQIALLTGPNMAGKSTYIRQVALIAFARASRMLGARDQGPHRPRRPHLLPRRGFRRTLARQLDLHGRDERDGQHPQQRDRPFARRAR